MNLRLVKQGSRPSFGTAIAGDGDESFAKSRPRSAGPGVPK